MKHCIALLTDGIFHRLQLPPVRNSRSQMLLGELLDALRRFPHSVLLPNDFSTQLKPVFTFKKKEELCSGRKEVARTTERTYEGTCKHKTTIPQNTERYTRVLEERGLH